MTKILPQLALLLLFQACLCLYILSEIRVGSGKVPRFWPWAQSLFAVAVLGSRMQELTKVIQSIHALARLVPRLKLGMSTRLFRYVSAW